MKKRLVVMAVILGGIALLAACSPASAKRDRLVIAYSPFESTALMWIAQDQHYFENNGLDVTLRRYDSGAASLDGVLGGEAQIAVGVTEFPVVGRALAGKPIRVLASVDRGEFIYVVGRRDRGIASVSDLKGKRVGTTKGTIADFYLGRFLESNGMSLAEVSIVDVKTPDRWVGAVADGQIDAISTAEPYADALKKRLGGNAVSWSAQSNQSLYALAASTDDWVSRHPEAVRRFLESLAQAEQYLNAHPAEAKAIVAKRLTLDASETAAVWDRNQFRLGLDQSLIVAMEDEARWLIRNKLTSETVVPDFETYVHATGLKSVKPGAVNIVR